MDVLGIALVILMALAVIAATVLWLRGEGQPIVLRDAAGHPVDPIELEGDDPEELPPTTRDNRYVRGRRLPQLPVWTRSGTPVDPQYDAMRERERLTRRLPTKKDD